MDSKLYNAAMEGNINILKLNKEHLNLQLTPNKNTVLHIAALFGQTECDTALQLAAREGQQDSVNALIECAKKLDAEGTVELESGSTITKKMLRAANEDGDTALHDSVRLYCHQIKLHWFKIFSVLVPKPNSIRLLTEEDPEYTYMANNEAETPLYIAAKRRHHQVVSQILKTCTTLAYGGPGGRTALHASVICNNEVLLHWWMGYSSIFKKMDRKMWNALPFVALWTLWKVRNEYTFNEIHPKWNNISELIKESTKTLLDWIKDLAKEPDMYGWTPLHYAAQFGHVERAKQLPDVDKSIAYVIADKDDKQTALHVAASQGHVGVMKELLSQLQNENKKAVKFILENSQLSSFVNHKDIDGNTPLHLAATALCANQLIYDEKSDRMAFNKGNQTPLDVTTQHENVTLVTQALKRSESKKFGPSLGWRNIISDDNENLMKKMKANDKRKRFTPKDIKKTEDTHMILAALIATVTFAAGFTMPGGYNGNQGPTQGMAILRRETAFQAFAVTNTIAMILSTSAIVTYFLGKIGLKGGPSLVKLLIEEDGEFKYEANSAGEAPLYIAREKGSHAVVSEILKPFRAPTYGGPGGNTNTLLDSKKDLVKEPDMYG
ncbi:unnamed protein product [Camellia sinensis]